MTELKTLKDLEYNVNGTEEVLVRELKAEAVKWVKKHGADTFNPWYRLFCKFNNLTEEDLK